MKYENELKYYKFIFQGTRVIFNHTILRSNLFLNNDI